VEARSVRLAVQCGHGDAAADGGGDVGRVGGEIFHHLVARGEAVGVDAGDEEVREAVVPAGPLACSASQRSMRQRSAMRWRSRMRWDQPRWRSWALIIRPAWPPPTIRVSTFSTGTERFCFGWGRLMHGGAGAQAGLRRAMVHRKAAGPSSANPRSGPTLPCAPLTQLRRVAMQHENSSVPLPHARALVPWNKGRFAGPKPPLKPK